jgi:hypothetical protein
MKRELRGLIRVKVVAKGLSDTFMSNNFPNSGATTEEMVCLAVAAARDGETQFQAGALRAQAMRCRRLAQSLTDQQAVDTLLVMAGEYDVKAQSLRPN